MTRDYIEKSNADFKIMNSERESFIMFFTFNPNDIFSISSKDTVYRKGIMNINHGYGDRLYASRNSNIEIKINNSVLNVPIKKLRKYIYI